jgi:tRNA(Phe) wybutosine-synthesizing methylase Tyw3
MQQRQRHRQSGFAKMKQTILDGLVTESTMTDELRDNSLKGCVDEPIVELMQDLNRCEHFVTTSSCSGRIVLFQQSLRTQFQLNKDHETSLPSSSSSSDSVASSSSSSEPLPSSSLSSSTKSVGGDLSEKKKGGGGSWLLVRHAQVTFDEVFEALDAGIDRDDARGCVWLRHEPFILHVACATQEHGQRLLEVARASGFRESGLSVGRKKIMVAVRTTSLTLHAPIAHAGHRLATDQHLRFLVVMCNDQFEQNVARTQQFHRRFNDAFVNRTE